MYDPEVANLIDRFIENVGDYFRWKQLEGLIALNLKGQLEEDIHDPSMPGKIREAFDKRMDAGAEIERCGSILAPMLEEAGIDSSGVLRVVHCARGGGGGAEALSPVWADIKVQLQRTAIQVRTGKPGIESTPDASVKGPAGEQPAPIAGGEVPAATKPKLRRRSSRDETIGKAVRLAKLIEKEEVEQLGRTLTNMLAEVDVPVETFQKSAHLKEARDNWKRLQAAREANIAKAVAKAIAKAKNSPQAD